MVALVPHYLLIVETHTTESAESAAGQWRVRVHRMKEQNRFEGVCREGRRALSASSDAGPDRPILDAMDSEAGLFGERLQLFATIRGLEAIGEPSRVTLLTDSQYVIRGIRNGLDAWKEMNWTWERFGELHPVKNSDLWRRLDRARQFHQIRCRTPGAWRRSENRLQTSVSASFSNRRTEISVSPNAPSQLPPNALPRLRLIRFPGGGESRKVEPAAVSG